MTQSACARLLTSTPPTHTHTLPRRCETCRTIRKGLPMHTGGTCATAGAVVVQFESCPHTSLLARTAQSWFAYVPHRICPPPHTHTHTTHTYAHTTNTTILTRSPLSILLNLPSHCVCARAAPLLSLSLVCGSVFLLLISPFILPAQHRLSVRFSFPFSLTTQASYPSPQHR